MKLYNAPLGVLDAGKGLEVMQVGQGGEYQSFSCNLETRLKYPAYIQNNPLDIPELFYVPIKYTASPNHVAVL